ncbi:MAG: hypothetical protein U0736_20960 [Gemmataceae bacterium]
MSLPRDPRRDLRLDRLDDRDGVQPAHLGSAAHVGSSLSAGLGTRDATNAYRALIDAVFTAPGATEWLAVLRRKVAAYLADRDSERRPSVPSDAIRAADDRWD